MRRFNILYLSIPIVLYGLMLIYRGVNRSTASFFGVAENQETEINLEHDATVGNIYVTQGQFVTKGTLLLEVRRSMLDYKMSELQHNISSMLVKDQLNTIEIQGRLDRLKAERAEKVGVIQARIRLLESEEALNRELFHDLKSIPGDS